MFFLFQHATVAGHVNQAKVERFALIPYRLTHLGKDCSDQSAVFRPPLPAGVTPSSPVCEGQTVDGSQVVGVQPHNQPNALLTIFTSMFMHGGWLHILGNMLFLWIFGNNVEDSMGRPKFVLFYLLGGIVAALAQV